MSKVAVIGGGPMGLATAYELLKQGQDVVLYEGGNVVGGMTASFNFGGMEIERYYHFICQPDKSLLKLLKELRINGKLRWIKTRMGFYYNGKLYSWGSAAGLLSFSPLTYVERIRYGLHAFISVFRKNWQQLDGQDAVSWIKKWIGNHAYEVTWQSLFEHKFYRYTNNLSAAWIWSRIHRVGNSPLIGYLEGGSETLLQALVHNITRMNGVIHLNTPVTKVDTNSEEKKIVHTHHGAKKFDTVISTIPLRYVPRMMPDLPRTLLDQYSAVENIAVVCVLVKLHQQVTENFWLNVNDSRMDIPGIIEYTNLRPMQKHLVYVPYYMPNDHPMYSESDEVFEKKVRRYLGIINPDLPEDAIEAIKVSRYKWAQPICPPHFLQTIPPARTGVSRLYIADTSYYYPEDRSIAESVKLGKELALMVVEDVAQNG